MPLVGKDHQGLDELNHQGDSKGELVPKRDRCQENLKTGSKILTLSSR
jgi:hypothetical protein